MTDATRLKEFTKLYFIQWNASHFSTADSVVLKSLSGCSSQQLILLVKNLYPFTTISHLLFSKQLTKDSSVKSYNLKL